MSRIVELIEEIVLVDATVAAGTIGTVTGPSYPGSSSVVVSWASGVSCDCSESEIRSIRPGHIDNNDNVWI